MIRAISMAAGAEGRKTLLVPKRAGPSMVGVTTIPSVRLRNQDFFGFLELNDPDVVLIESTVWEDHWEGIAQYVNRRRVAVIGSAATTWEASLAPLYEKDSHSLLKQQLRAVVLVDQFTYLCPLCSRADKPENLRHFEKNWNVKLDPGARVLCSTGCSGCQHSGKGGSFYLSRVMWLTSGIREALLQGRPVSEVLRIANKQGTEWMPARLMDKIKSGVLSLEEANRIHESSFHF